MNTLFPTTKKRTRRKADALVLKISCDFGKYSGDKKKYVEQKNTAIPVRTAVCTEKICIFIPGDGKPVPAVTTPIMWFFPALDMILAIAFFGKTALAYFDYKKHGQFEWTGPVILFACLVLTLTAPTYIWTIIGI